MKKVIRELTQDQKERGVIFSSQLMPGGTLHEVTAANLCQCSPGTTKIKLLEDDSFFNNSAYKYNLIRK
jgi:hypothetical protein